MARIDLARGPGRARLLVFLCFPAAATSGAEEEELRPDAGMENLSVPLLPPLRLRPRSLP